MINISITITAIICTMMISMTINNNMIICIIAITGSFDAASCLSSSCGPVVRQYTFGTNMI